VEVPTMILWGTGDAYMSPMLLERSLAKVSGPATVHRLEGVSHWVQQEVPDVVNAHLLEFLATV
jgi:pimeloyl-ACP methyl ester carboxylesterase